MTEYNNIILKFDSVNQALDDAEKFAFGILLDKILTYENKTKETEKNSEVL